MEIDYKHELADEDARARLEALGEYLVNRHGIKVSWEGSRARFEGKYMVVKIAGELTMSEHRVMFRGEDPGFLWRKRALEYMQGKLSRYLDPKIPLSQLSRS